MLTVSLQSFKVPLKVGVENGECNQSKGGL